MLVTFVYSTLRSSRSPLDYSSRQVLLLLVDVRANSMHQLMTQGNPVESVQRPQMRVVSFAIYTDLL